MPKEQLPGNGRLLQGIVAINPVLLAPESHFGAVQHVHLPPDELTFPAPEIEGRIYRGGEAGRFVQDPMHATNPTR